MKKRFLSLLMVLCMALPLGALAEIPADFHAEGYPIVDTPITLTIGIRQSVHEGDFAEMEVFKKLQDLTGVNLEFVLVPEANFAETFNLMMAGDEYPDMWYGRGTAAMDLTSYINAGMLVGLRDLIEQYAPNIKKMMDTEEYAWEKFMINGDLYGVPWLYTQLEEMVEDKWYINQVWLDQLGLEVPTTLAEFRTVMEAFRDNDMNGNGDPNDEIPFTFWYGYYGLGSLHGSWGVADNQANHMMSIDGKVVFAPMQDGYREGIKFWRDMYTDGLLWNQTITGDYGLHHTIGQGEDATIGSFIRHVGGSVVGNERLMDYTYVPPLKADDGSEPVWKTTDTPYNASNCFLITDKCEYPEVAIRLADYFCSEQGTLEFRYGPEDLVWHWNDDGTWTLTWDKLPEGVTGSMVSPGGYAFCWCSEELMEKQRFDDPEFEDARVYYHYVNHDQVYLPYQMDEYVPNNLPFTPEESEELSLLWSTIWNYVREVESKALISEIDIDAYWDEYISTLQAMSIDRVLEIYQGAYDRMTGA